MRRPLPLLLVFLAVGPLGAGSATFVVDGARPVARAINGYTQEVVSLGEGRWLVHVATELAPLRAPQEKTQGEDSPAGSLYVPPGFTVPSALEETVRRPGDPFGTAERVLRWVREQIRVVENERVPQDAISVLRRRSARCSGLANAAVALLRAAGLPARPVSGILVAPEGPIPHRWLEVHFGEAGWVASDPTIGLWVITPRHVVCAAPAVGELSVVVRGIVDDDLADLPRIGGAPSRPVDGAVLLVHLSGVAERGMGDRGTVVLSGPGGVRHRKNASTDVRFGALLPGLWRLRLEVDGTVVRAVSLRLAEGDVRSLVLSYPEMEAS